MDFMFSGCLSLGYVDLSKLSLENVESMENMFSNCHSLERIGLNNVKTKNLKTAKSMFFIVKI